MDINAIKNTYNNLYNSKSNKPSNVDVENDFANLLSSKAILHNKIEEMQENIKSGNVNFDPVFQIGGKAYSQEEWEKLLKYVDEVETETQEAMEIEQEQIEKESDEEEFFE